MKLPTSILVLCLTATSVASAEFDPLDDERYVPSMGRPGAHRERMARNPLFADYVYRLKYRRMNALALRRQYNMSRGPHVYQINQPSYLANPFWSAIERGRVWQPPIRRPVLVVPPPLSRDPFYSSSDYFPLD